MAKTPGVPGTAVFLAAAGGFLLFIAIQDVGPVDGLRSLIKGVVPGGSLKEPTALPDELAFVAGDQVGAALGSLGTGAGGAIGSGIGAAGSTLLGPRIAAAAQKYQGVKYVWGGATPAGWDCSGFVTWVLHKDCGLNLPSNAHTTSAGFMVWKGASTIPRDNAAPGDLLCWAGHIAINLGGGQMIHAPTFGQPTKVAKWMAGPTVRRVNAQ